MDIGKSFQLTERAKSNAFCELRCIPPEFGRLKPGTPLMIRRPLRERGTVIPREVFFQRLVPHRNNNREAECVWPFRERSFLGRSGLRSSLKSFHNY